MVALNFQVVVPAIIVDPICSVMEALILPGESAGARPAVHGGAAPIDEVARVAAVAGLALSRVVAVLRDHRPVIKAEADVVAGDRVRDAPPVATSPLDAISPTLVPIWVVLVEVCELLRECPIVTNRLAELRIRRQRESTRRGFVL